MINVGRNYATVKPLRKGEYRQLRAGGYICTIKDAIQGTTKKGGLLKLTLVFDIADGEFAGMFKNNADNAPRFDQIVQDKNGNTVPYFKALIEDIEQSNFDFYFEGQYLDETKLRGRRIGVIFGDVEYLNKDNEVKIYTKPYEIVTVEKIENGDFKIPPLQKLEDKSYTTSTKYADNEMEIEDEKLPF